MVDPDGNCKVAALYWKMPRRYRLVTALCYSPNKFMSDQRHIRTRKVSLELLIALTTVAASLVFLPGIVFVVGSKLFGSYNGGLRQFYVDTLHDLLTFTWTAWVLILLPALCVLAVRMIFAPMRSVDASANSKPPTSERKEPTLN
jgi:hypothetical protein